MQVALACFFMLVFVLLCLLGILANGFIVLVLSTEWRHRGKLVPSDKILLSLGASRFCLQWVGMVNSFYYSLHLTEYSKGRARQVFGLQWDFLNTATYWFGAWLSVLYCVKIANFSHPAFLWLKWRVPGLVTWLLLGSLLISCGVSLLFFWGNYSVFRASSTTTFSGNLTYKEWTKNLEISYFLPLKFVTLFVPCSAFLVSTALLIHSLRMHLSKMNHHAHNLQDPLTQAHTQALKSLISFLLLYALSFVTLIIDAGGFFSSESDWYWPWQSVIYLCTSVHPLILILGNLRLRGGFRQLLLARGCWPT